MKHRGHLFIILLLLANPAWAQLVSDTYISQLKNKNVHIKEKIPFVVNKIIDLKTASPHIALTILDTSLSILTLSYGHNNIAPLLHEKGKLLYKTGQLKKALSIYLQAETAFEQLEDKKTLEAISNEIGWIFIKEGKYALARKQFQKSLELAQETKTVSYTHLTLPTKRSCRRRG